MKSLNTRSQYTLQHLNSVLERGAGVKLGFAETFHQKWIEREKFVSRYTSGSIYYSVYYFENPLQLPHHEAFQVLVNPNQNSIKMPINVLSVGVCRHLNLIGH